MELHVSVHSSWYYVWVTKGGGGYLGWDATLMKSDSMSGHIFVIFSCYSVCYKGNNVPYVYMLQNHRNDFS